MGIMKIILKLPFKKNALNADYILSLKYPIDYRYLSFNHITTLKLIWKINKTLKIGKIQNALNDLRIDLIVFNVRFLEFCSCKEIKKQDKIRLNEAWE
jgi:hypothetical protein